MRNLSRIRKRFFTVLTVLTVIDVVLLGYLLWPGSSNAGRKAREAELQHKLQSLNQEVGPLKDIDKTLVRTRSDIATFYKDRVPDRWSEISSQLDKLTRDAGVVPQNIHYSTNKTSDKNDLQGIQPVEIDTSVSGEYAKVARFINSLEQDKLIFIIEQVTLSGQEGGTVTLQIKFETFLKEAPTEQAQS
ncbi:MAG TPA: type 4a pilus biogenesis protein PilO [Candidatus Acidoferrales bacterium]|jgi:Tfp pilus assembly protein PilO|nr:type 4a pilus biogenesis protein PilO [Candidatus Acidoferrales bacterium]